MSGRSAHQTFGWWENHFLWSVDYTGIFAWIHVWHLRRIDIWHATVIFAWWINVHWCTYLVGSSLDLSKKIEDAYLWGSNSATLGGLNINKNAIFNKNVVATANISGNCRHVCAADFFTHRPSDRLRRGHEVFAPKRGWLGLLLSGQ